MRYEITDDELNELLDRIEQLQQVNLDELPESVGGYEMALAV